MFYFKISKCEDYVWREVSGYISELMPEKLNTVLVSLGV